MSVTGGVLTATAGHLPPKQTGHSFSLWFAHGHLDMSVSRPTWGVVGGGREGLGWGLIQGRPAAGMLHLGAWPRKSPDCVPQPDLLSWDVRASPSWGQWGKLDSQCWGVNCSCGKAVSVSDRACGGETVPQPFRSQDTGKSVCTLFY